MTIRNTFSIPVLPSEFDDFQKTVLPIFTAKAVLYGIPPLSLTNLAPKTVKWNGYVLICDTAATAGPGATANRNEYQPEYSNEISIIIEDYLLNNKDVTAADALSFRIHQMGGSRVALPAPVSTVLATITYLEPLAHYLKFADSLTGKVARPKGVAFVQVRYIVANVAPTSVNECNQEAFLTSKNDRIQYASEDQGKKAFYFGRYINSHGLCGPWCKIFDGVII